MLPHRLFHLRAQQIVQCNDALHGAFFVGHDDKLGGGIDQQLLQFENGLVGPAGGRRLQRGRAVCGERRQRFPARQNARPARLPAPPETARKDAL